MYRPARLGIRELHAFCPARDQRNAQAASTLELNAIPFVTHIEDCVECDAGSRQSDGTAWNLPALIAQLSYLRTRASKTEVHLEAMKLLVAALEKRQ